MRGAVRTALAALLLALALGAPRAAAAQEAGLERFAAQVARLWAAGAADGLADLAPRDGRIVLELGEGPGGPVQARHAAAALRDLFSGREGVSVRPSRVTVSGGEPLSGFAELAWVSRSRGVSTTRTETVYVGVVEEGGAWRIRELRILR